MIRITAKQEGFRRCGIAHSVASVEYNDDQFTAEQLARLKSEPMLVVEVVEVAKEEGGASRLNANDAIAKVKAAATAEILDVLAEGEDRKSVIAAIEARRKELAPEGAE